jgi:two-component system OmpR family sensor kinase
VTIAGIGVAAAVLAAVSAVAWRELAAWLTAQRAVRLRAQARPVIDRRIEHLGGQLETAELATILALDLASRETAALVIAPGGVPLAAAPAEGRDGPAAEPLDPALYEAAFRGDPHATYVTRGPRGARLLHALIPPRGWLPGPPAIVHLIADLEPERRVLAALGTILAATLAVTVAAAVALELALGDAWPLLAALVAAPAAIAARRLLPGARLGGEPPARKIAASTERDAPSAAASPAAQASQPPAGMTREDFTAAMRRVEAAFLERQASEERMRRFVADASHELRTPLTAVGGAADVLLRGAKDDPEQVERLARLVRSRADAMAALVEGLLTLARLDAGVTLRREAVDLGRVAREHAEELTVSAPGRRIAVDAPHGVVVEGDPDLLRQVLANLTGNALRHAGPDASVKIAVARDGGTALVRVADDGPGIAPEERERLFERFYRGAGAQSADGSGLGLAIVGEIVAAHGGAAEIVETPGGGATFVVRLPA